MRSVRTVQALAPMAACGGGAGACSAVGARREMGYRERVPDCRHDLDVGGSEFIHCEQGIGRSGCAAKVRVI